MSFLKPAEKLRTQRTGSSRPFSAPLLRRDEEPTGNPFRCGATQFSNFKSPCPRLGNRWSVSRHHVPYSTCQLTLVVHDVLARRPPLLLSPHSQQLNHVTRNRRRKRQYPGSLQTRRLRRSCEDNLPRYTSFSPLAMPILFPTDMKIL